nr:DUF4838 domain-containing protein [uncultured Dyadobacter sp.]
MMHGKLTLKCATCIGLLCFLTFSLFAQQPVKDGQWLTDWLLCGPFPLAKATDPAQAWDHLSGYEAAFLKKIGGEETLSPKEGASIRSGKQSFKWVMHHANDSIIDLRKAISASSPLFAYAYTEVYSLRNEIRSLALGTNDGGSLWLNGRLVWDHPSERGLKSDDDVIPVALHTGINKLLLKVEQRGNRWEFCARFLPFHVTQLSGQDLLRIEPRANGEAVVASTYSQVVLHELVRKVKLTVKNEIGREIVSTEKTNDFTGVIDLKGTDYQNYYAYFDIQLTSGEAIHFDQRFNSGKRAEYALFKDHNTAYRIAIDANASESERWAAGELARWLKEVSGAEFPVQELARPYNGPQIVVGFNNLVKQKLGINAPADSDESYRYLNAGPDILIFGGRQRGSMYGVLAFLENELGCRWYTPSVQSIPTRSELKFIRFAHSERPGVRVRNDFYFEAFDPTWATRNKMNGSMGTPKQPGGIESYWAVHTFYPLMPPEEFYGQHPEYYSLINGKRIHDHAQLCLSNPAVLRIITERIKKRMRESPEYLIYDVSQNDWYNPCECTECQSIVKREGAESGIIIWFVNQVADAVAQEFPGKFIGTLAYQYTRKPPLHIRPKNNVVVRLCSIECCFAHDFKSCPENQEFLTELNDWSARAPHLYIWDYVVNFSHYVMPFPNFRVLQPNIRTFRENNAIGIMEQAAYQSRGGEFAELRAYLIAKLLWNPDCDQEAVIDDFMNGYYGRAGKFVRQYFDLLHNRLTPNTHIHLGLEPGDPVFSDDFVQQAYQIFEEARKVAGDDAVLKRVEMASLPLLYLKCRRMPVVARYDGTYERFCRIADREEVKFFSEAGGREAFHSWVKSAK